MILTIWLLILLTTVGQGYGEWSYRYRFEPIEKQFDSIAARMDSLDQHHRLGEGQMDDYRVLDSIVRMQPSAELEARLLYWEVKCHQYTMESDSMIAKLERALALAGEGGYDRLRIAYQLAGNYQRTNRLTEAWQLLTNVVIPGMDEVGDSIMLGNAYHLYALIYRDIGDVDEAMRSIDEAQRCFTASGYPLSKVHFFKALLAPDGLEAASLYQKAIAADSTDVTIVAQAYTNLANIALEKNQNDSARHWVNCGLEAIDRYQPENKLLRAFLLVNDALLDHQAQQYKQALRTLTEVERLCGPSLSKYNAAAIYRIISETYGKVGNQTEELNYLKQYIKAQENQQRIVSETQEMRMRARSDIQRQQRELIEKLTEEATMQRRKTWGIVVVLIVVVALAIAMLTHYYRKRKQREVENSELRNVLQQEAVGALVTSGITDDGDRSRAEKRFGQLRPGFFARLKEINPDLTENDLRLCTYISIGMRAKEIAQQLSVTPDSVNTARYRLRKKLNLKPEEKLDEFLRNL
jgi:tetratricopeptide (TPR) repeat protein